MPAGSSDTAIRIWLVEPCQVRRQQHLTGFLKVALGATTIDGRPFHVIMQCYMRSDARKQFCRVWSHR